MLSVRPQAETGMELYAMTHRHLCPDCRSMMDEVERLNENGVLYVWFQCTRDGCGGQWLEKSRGA